MLFDFFCICICKKSNMTFSKKFFYFFCFIICKSNEFWEVIIRNIIKNIDYFLICTLKRNGVFIKISCIAKSFIKKRERFKAVFYNMLHKAVISLKIIPFVIILHTQKKISFILTVGCPARGTNQISFFILEISVFTFRTNDSYHTFTLILLFEQISTHTNPIIP